MWTIREIDYEKDIPGIVELLNRNMSSQRSVNSFLWKHFENPFGKSYGLLSVDSGNIIAIRMFMRWEFVNIRNSHRIRAIRPVDTCTDKRYRKKGIFRKLALAGIDNLKGQYDIIFNSPNANSKPGNLSMGWQEIKQKFIYKVGIVNPLHKKYEYSEGGRIEGERREFFLNRFADYTTYITDDFLNWRFKNPEYRIAKFGKSGMIIFRIVKIKGIRAILPLDVFGQQENFSAYLHSVCSKNKIRVVYFLNNAKNCHFKFLFTLKRSSQSVLYKDDDHGISKKICFTFGDLEGRL